ncbi:NAC domain-containing protein 83-like isoform X3 [Setaria italica]|uniref:NAC domain-containing protein 83-like isoform X3 n=1 Tax=Setaria italica TaxID=4555 RepID=UPI0003509C3E|nr:NAC domain-containing protein 83-like isoform X3 [Setaria italica]XP_034592874.1 NAC domain-containing protein 83-like isoform X3 [Setaria viridis]
MEGRPAGAWRVQGPAGAPVAAGLPIGFRFRPTDEELLLHYLRRKALACPLPAGIIPDADLARLHPWDLLPPAGGDADGERFFFHLPATRCWRKGGGAARAAGTGLWRPSGKEKLVVSPRCKRPVGTKRTLVFYRGRGRAAARTDWAMHEYRLLPSGLHPFHGCAAAGNAPTAHVSCHGAAADWVVCRIFKRTKPAAHRGQEDDDAEEPSSPSSASSCVTDTSEAGDQEQDGDDEESSSSSSNGGSSCSVASN